MSAISTIAAEFELSEKLKATRAKHYMVIIN